MMRGRRAAVACWWMEPLLWRGRKGGVGPRPSRRQAAPLARPRQGVVRREAGQAGGWAGRRLGRPEAGQAGGWAGRRLGRPEADAARWGVPRVGSSESRGGPSAPAGKTRTQGRMAERPAGVTAGAAGRGRFQAACGRRGRGDAAHGAGRRVRIRAQGSSVAPAVSVRAARTAWCWAALAMKMPGRLRTSGRPRT